MNRVERLTARRNLVGRLSKPSVVPREGSHLTKATCNRVVSTSANVYNGQSLGKVGEQILSQDTSSLDWQELGCSSSTKW